MSWVVTCRDLSLLHLLIFGLAHFMLGPQINPQLETSILLAWPVSMRHLAVNDAPPRSHPLNVTGRESALVTTEVLMTQTAQIQNRAILEN